MPNTSILEENKLTPTITDIIADYDEIVDLLKDVKDIEELRRIAKREHITIEINGRDDYSDNWEVEVADGEIEFVRVDAYHWLDYIYFWYKDGKLYNIYFDVWSEEVYADFITDCRIDTLEWQYEEGIKWIEKDR